MQYATSPTSRAGAEARLCASRNRSRQRRCRGQRETPQPPVERSRGGETDGGKDRDSEERRLGVSVAERILEGAVIQQVPRTITHDQRAHGNRAGEGAGERKRNEGEVQARVEQGAELESDGEAQGIGEDSLGVQQRDVAGRAPKRRERRPTGQRDQGRDRDEDRPREPVSFAARREPEEQRRPLRRAASRRAVGRRRSTPPPWPPTRPRSRRAARARARQRVRGASRGASPRLPRQPCRQGSPGTRPTAASVVAGGGVTPNPAKPRGPNRVRNRWQTTNESHPTRSARPSSASARSSGASSPARLSASTSSWPSSAGG